MPTRSSEEDGFRSKPTFSKDDNLQNSESDIGSIDPDLQLLGFTNIGEIAQHIENITAREKAAQDRISQLVKVNEALQRSLTHLTTAENLQSFLLTVMQEAIHASGAVTAGVFVHDPTSDILHLFRAIVHHEVIEVASDPRVAEWRSLPTNFSDIWKQVQGGHIFWHDLENPPLEVTDRILSWHRQMGHQVLAWIPMMLKHHALGFLGLAFADKQQATESKLEQCRSLAQQAALALQISRLSEEAWQVAISREQEKAAQERAEEMAKTNAALQRSLSNLATSQSLNSFLPRVLLEVIEITGAVSAIVFVYRPNSDSFDLAGLCLHRKIVDIATDPRAAIWRAIPRETVVMWKQIIQSERYFWFNAETPSPDWDKHGSWHREMGHGGSSMIPMVVNGQIIGTMGLAYTQAKQPDAAHFEQCQLFAYQIALALCLSRLSEEAQQVAIAREQEKAAMERAVELARANQSLQRSIDQLAAARSLESFFTSLLQETIRILDGSAAQFFLYDAERDSLIPSLGINEEGIIQPKVTQIAGLPCDQPFPCNITGAWQKIRDHGHPVLFDLERDIADFWPTMIELHRSRGERGVIGIALLLGKRPLGLLGMAFRNRPPFTESDFAFLQALAQQATLALQIKQLAEEAQQTAIAREREQVAQERAEELAKTNAAMQRSLSSLADSETLQSFLPSAVREAIEISGAVSAAVFIYNATTHSFSLAEMHLWGEVVDINTDPRATFWQTIPPRTHAAWKKAAEIGKVHWYQNTEPPPDWDYETQWHYQLGHQGLGAIPMLVNGQVVGTLGLAFTEPEQPEGRLERCQFLVNQIALALYLSRLSKDAQQVAIVREREQSAQERAEELTSANAAMQRSLASLVRSKTLEAFLPTVLQEAIDISGAITAAVFAYQPASETFTLIAQYVLGRMRDLKTDPEAHYWSNIPSQTQAVWKQMAQAENIHWYDNSNPPPDWDYEVEWNWRKGHRGIAGIPMLVDGQIIGLLRLAFVEAEQPEGKLEQCQFLAHQIALALSLSQLSAEAQQVAVARAEEKAAQERAAELTTINEALTQRDRLLSVIAQITQELLENPDVEQAITQTTQIMGQAVGASSVNLLQQKEHTDTGRLYHHLIVEWTDPCTPRQSDELATCVVYNDDIVPLVTRLHAGETMSLYLEDYPEFLRAHLGRFGLKTSCVAPIFVEDCYFGCLCFDNYVDRRLWTAQEIEVLSAGAGVIGTALLRQRLVDQVIQARAEQERAAELARSNEALTKRDRLLSALAHVTQDLLENPNVEQAINQALQKLGQAADSDRLKLLEERRDPTTGLLKHYVIMEWAAPNIPRQIDDPYTNTINNEDFRDVFAALHAGQSLCLYLDEYPIAVQPYLARVAIKASGIMPVFVEGKYYGCLCFDNCLERRLWSDQERDVLTAGAGAIGSALLRQKLVERLVQARAEQERAAEIEETNRSLQRTISYLNANPSLQAFLHAVLQEAITVSGAVTSAVFTYDDTTQSIQQIACILHGKVVNIATDPQMEIWRTPAPANITPAWNLLCQNGILWLDNEASAPEHWEPTIPWHRQFGHKTIVCLLLSAGNQPMGFLGLCFATPVPLEGSKLAQCRALAQQVALALRLEILSQQATQSALLEERNRLAGEIHDTLAQSFTGINFQVNLAKRIAHKDPEEAQRIYDHIAQLAQNGLAEARRSVWSLYSANEAYEDLEQDLHHCVEKIMGSASSIQVTLKTSGVPYRLSESIGKNLLRIGQEAITNILKHAQATLIEIEILYQAHQICLQVKDNGCGFSSPNNYKGFGLIGMAERAERINGQLTITSHPDQGTSVFIQVPYSNPTDL